MSEHAARAAKRASEDPGRVQDVRGVGVLLFEPERREVQGEAQRPRCRQRKPERRQARGEARRRRGPSAKSDEMAPPPTAPEAMPAPVESEPLVSETGIKVAKVIVDVLNFPSLGGPMVRVRGFDSALEEAFTATLLLEEGATIREMFETGRYLDQEASGLLYTWEPDVVEYVDDAKAKLETLAGCQDERGDAPNPFPDSSASEGRRPDHRRQRRRGCDRRGARGGGRPGRGRIPAELPELASPSPTIEEDSQVAAPARARSVDPGASCSSPRPQSPRKPAELVPPVSAPKTTVKTSPRSRV